MLQQTVSVSKDAQVTTKDACLHPVKEDEHPIPRADLHAFAIPCETLCLQSGCHDSQQILSAGARLHSYILMFSRRKVLGKHLLGDVYASPKEEADVSCDIKHSLPSFQLSHCFVTACASMALISMTKQCKSRYMHECCDIPAGAYNQTGKTLQ